MCEGGGVGCGSNLPNFVHEKYKSLVFFEFQMSARRRGMRFARKLSGNQSARTAFDFLNLNLMLYAEFFSVG
jgi:hypothetical protein